MLPSSQKSIVKLFKPSKKTKSDTKGEKPGPVTEGITTIKDLKESLLNEEMTTAEESAPAISPVETAEVAEEEAIAPVQNKEGINAKKLLFAASIVGIAAKMVGDKIGKAREAKKVPEPTFTTHCLGQVCLRIPKKIGKE